jgi:anti-sigma-K factor RskA
MGMYDPKNKSKVQAMKSVEIPQAFAITLEKEGGNPTPTMEEMYMMGTI